jgi:DNA-binding response OmpR family regulator
MVNTRSLHVLVVEDSQETANALALTLRMEGHEVGVVRDGTTALESACKLPPDVVLLDLGLPGIDGFAVANGIRERCTPRRPFLVALTGRDDSEALDSSLAAGIDLYLVKPVEPATLQSLLGRLRDFVQGVEGPDTRQGSEPGTRV